MDAHANSLVSRPEGPSFGWVDHWCLGRLAAALRGAPIEVQLWDGRAIRCSDLTPIGTVLVTDRATLIRLIQQPALAFGEAYADGRLLIRGDLATMLEATNRALDGRPYQKARWVRPRPPDDARHNVHVHYDIGNRFYQWWLDASMAYTCAYFERPDATLEEAQRAKFDYICRKLQLTAGQRVIEAGCGWGGLALHMAREYGVTVTAYNLSREQLTFARDRASREGLADRVAFVDGDCRSIDGQADAFVSVGMLEHVGPEHYGSLGEVISRVLGPSGRGLLHFIGRNKPMQFNPWITRYIFPGAYAPALSEVLPDVLERHYLSVLDVENLRLHYAETLRHWLERFERRASEIGAEFDERFVRTWRLYLASALACFRSGDLQLFQVTFARSVDNTVPLVRRHLYEREDVRSL